MNGQVLTEQLTADGNYVDSTGDVVENNIDHKKYADESVGTKILVYSKTSHRVELWSNGILERWYPATSGKTTGDKEIEGDGKTPLGTFYICRKIPNSNYTRGLLVSYPSTEDAERGIATGLIDQRTYQTIVGANATGAVPPQETVLGGEIEFHGSGQIKDVTRGCIGLKDMDIVDLYERVPQGTRVDILA